MWVGAFFNASTVDSHPENWAKLETLLQSDRLLLIAFRALGALRTRTLHYI